MATYRRNSFNSVTVALERPEAFDAFASALRTNHALGVDVMRESDYFSRASAIMALGAAFGALTAMHSAVSTSFLVQHSRVCYSAVRASALRET